MTRSGGSGVPVLAAFATFLAICGAWWMQPRVSGGEPPRLSDVVPANFGDWRQVDTAFAPIDPTSARTGARDTDDPYDDVLMRAYSNSRGNVVLLALAYGRNQHQEVKIHRPELCYVAQGFKLLKSWPGAFKVPATNAAAASGARMLVRSPVRTEAVSYWIRIGGSYSANSWETRYYIFKEGLRRRSLDGILVRVSQVLETPNAASDELYRVQERFIADLLGAMPVDGRQLLVKG